MGIVRSIQKGDADASEFSKDAQDAAKKMKKKDVKKFAKTKHKGLPTKVRQEIDEIVNDVVEEHMMSEENLNENPAAIAAAQRMVVQSKGKKISVNTARNSRYKDRDPAAHKKAKSIFQRIVDKFKKKKEGVNEAKYKGYDYKRQKRKDGLSLIVPALRKTFSNMKDLKKYIDKHGKMESVNEAPTGIVKKAIELAKSMGGNMSGAVKRIEKMKKGLSKQKDVKKALRMANESVNQDVFFESTTKDGMTETHIYWESDGKPHGYTFNFVNELNEAEYQGRKVKLGKVMQGDTKKFKVYVKNPKGNVVKVNFGQGGKAKGGTMRIRKSNPKARANFRARHNCDNPGPRHKARYWSCKKW